MLKQHLPKGLIALNQSMGIAIMVLIMTLTIPYGLGISLVGVSVFAIAIAMAYVAHVRDFDANDHGTPCTGYDSRPHSRPRLVVV